AQGALRAVVRRVGAVPRTRLTAGAAVVALAVSVPFGGLRESEAAVHPALDARIGQVVDAAPFDLTITGASLVDALTSTQDDGSTKELMSPEAADGHLLILKVTVVNTTAASVSWTLLRASQLEASGAPTQDAVLYAQLSGGGELVGASSVLSVDDATPVETLSPGVTYHLAIVTEVSAPVPVTVRVGVARLSYDPGPDRSASWWQHPEPAYDLRIPVVDKRDGGV
ncbi:MAG: hypothetical protein QM572_09105, partial [Nocardioides sp.]|uniref:hypothetical protein n=1 Tax=Nocardioides sp. TaxID=35761 RepID=UPI0039E25057